MKTVSSISTAGVWSCPATTGDRPPPRSALTFTAVDDRRAVLFGGKNWEQERMNDFFIIDLSTMVLVCVCVCIQARMQGGFEGVQTNPPFGWVLNCLSKYEVKLTSNIDRSAYSAMRLSKIISV